MSRRYAEGVEYDASRGRHVVVLVLLPTEAQAVADGLGPHDAAAVVIRRWADEAERLNTEQSAQSDPTLWCATCERYTRTVGGSCAEHPVPRTQEQKVAFRKAWDARVDEGSKKETDA